MNRSESKYFNTAVRMDEAFLSLLEKKSFDYITVKEVCDTAGVNRSTFYLHYETVGDLLEESISYMHKRFLSTFQGKVSQLPDIQNCPKEDLMFITSDYLHPYLEFIRKNQKLYRTAIKHSDILQADRTYQEMFQNIFDPILERFLVPAPMRQYYMIFYLNGIKGVIEQWLKAECEDPIIQMIDVIQNCILRGHRE